MKKQQSKDTTIRITKHRKQLLEAIKRANNFKGMDEVIQHLIGGKNEKRTTKKARK